MNHKTNDTSNTANTGFSKEEWLRYTRHVQLPQIGATGQQKLKNSHALIVGAGGLGSPVSLYLAAAGVGTITLIDHDNVDVTNLQRQILFTSDAIRTSKAQAGAAHLKKLNPHLNIKPIDKALDKDLATELIEQADIVLDCTDNFATRYLINDTCHTLNTPWVFASIHQFSGQCSLFSNKTGCFRCLFPEYPHDIDDCNSAGVLGVLPGLLGTLQANEALKFLCGLETPLEGQLLLADAMSLQFNKITLGSSPECACCGKQPATNDTLAKDYVLPTCHSELQEYEISAISFSELKELNTHYVLDVRSKEERAAFHLDSEHIPLDELEQHYAELDQSKIIICYCQSGKRSLKAATFLKDKGFNCVSINGGLAMILRNTPLNTYIHAD